MRNPLSFLWLDDHSGKHSDTTLRTWLFVIPLVVFICVVTWHLAQGPMDPLWFAQISEFLAWLTGAALTGISGYTAKRFMERKHQDPRQILGDLLGATGAPRTSQRSRESESPSYAEDGDGVARSEKL